MLSNYTIVIVKNPCHLRVLWPFLINAYYLLSLEKVFWIGSNGTGEPLTVQYEQIISGKESLSTN